MSEYVKPEEGKEYYINGVSGNSFTIITPDPDLAEEIYDAYWNQEPCPVPGCGEEGCTDHFQDDECADHLIDWWDVSEGKYLKVDQIQLLIKYLPLAVSDLEYDNKLTAASQIQQIIDQLRERDNGNN